MRQDYLAIIRKADLVDLFKYGEFHIRTAVPFNGVLSEEDSDLFKAVTSVMNPFEYSFEYVMIHFRTDAYSSSSSKINIESVEGIYAFDHEAKEEFLGSLDIRLNIKVSPWSTRFDNLKRSFQITGALKGISNVWILFGLEEEKRTVCENLIPKSDIIRAYLTMSESSSPTSEDSLWVHLLRYERHSFYPRDIRGYFMDAIHVFCNYMSQGNAPEDVAEQTNIGKEILSIDSGCKFKSVLALIKGSDFDKQSNEISKCSFITVAPLFLFLKDTYTKTPEDVFSETYINNCKGIGDMETGIVAYLLGITLGHDKTYDAYYDKLPLKIFKEKIIESTPPEPTPEPTSQSEEEPIYALPGESQRISSVPASLFDNEPSYSNSNNGVIAIAYKGKQTNFESFQLISSPMELSEMVGNGYKIILTTSYSQQLSQDDYKRLKIIKKVDGKAREYIRTEYGITV